MPFPFYDIGLSVIRNAPQVVFNPALGIRFVFYWAMVYFVHTQYLRTTRLQGHLYGKSQNHPLYLTVVAVLEGILVGIAGSYIMTFFGVSFLPDGGGIIWVLAVALTLMLINVRLMCFSYAAGLVAVSSLVFGFPKVSIPALMGLVAVLHLMESLLILLNGSAGATPVYVERNGHPVGAFQLQRYWPVPVALLILAVVSPVQAATGGVAMPDWWPLLRTTPEILAHPGAIFFLHALPAAMGYGDMALTCPPRVKARRTSVSLAAYSLVLLGLAVASTYWAPLVWAAALFAPLGHEAVVKLSGRREAAARPYFVPPVHGTMVLDTVPRSPARDLGLGPGWVINAVNGREVTGRGQLDEALRSTGEGGRLTLDVTRPAFETSGRAARRRPGSRRLHAVLRPGSEFGVIPVPEAQDETCVEVAIVGPLANLFRRFVGRGWPFVGRGGPFVGRGWPFRGGEAE